MELRARLGQRHLGLVGRTRRAAALGRLLHQLVDVARPVEEAVFRVEMQVYEVSHYGVAA